jgi:hypothetical protein
MSSVVVDGTLSDYRLNIQAFALASHKPNNWCTTPLRTPTSQPRIDLKTLSGIPTMATQMTLTSKQAQRAEAGKMLGNRAFSTLNWDQITKAPKEPNPIAQPGNRTYYCITEREPDRQSVASIVVGIDNVAPRWKPGSEINFATYADGYPSSSDAAYAAQKLIAAAEEWNAAKVGVSFRWVQNVDDAAFVLQYGGEQGTVLASAFFPNNAVLNTLFVYAYAFDKTISESPRGSFKNYEIMQNVFLHELGHVLGLRHEFALDTETFEGEGAVRVFGTNPESVMSYQFPPLMQESDKAETRAFYGFPVIRDFAPDN